MLRGAKGLSNDTACYSRKVVIFSQFPQGYEINSSVESHLLTVHLLTTYSSQKWRGSSCKVLKIVEGNPDYVENHLVKF